MADDDTAPDAPPADWQTITPDRSWAELKKERAKLSVARADAKASAERLAQTEAALAEAQAQAKAAADLQAQLARTQSRLAMARAGIVDDDVADVADVRYAKYAAAAGKDAKPQDAWLLDGAKEDPIMGRLLTAPAAPAPTPGQRAPAPVVPTPTPTPTVNGAQTAEDIARIRAQHGGRLPKAVQEQIGTAIDMGALLRR